MSNPFIRMASLYEDIRNKDKHLPVQIENEVEDLRNLTSRVLRRIDSGSHAEKSEDRPIDHVEMQQWRLNEEVGVKSDPDLNQRAVKFLSHTILVDLLCHKSITPGPLFDHYAFRFLFFDTFRRINSLGFSFTQRELEKFGDIFGNFVANHYDEIKEGRINMRDLWIDIIHEGLSDAPRVKEESLNRGNEEFYRTGWIDKAYKAIVGDRDSIPLWERDAILDIVVRRFHFYHDQTVETLIKEAKATFDELMKNANGEFIKVPAFSRSNMTGFYRPNT